MSTAEGRVLENRLLPKLRYIFGRHVGLSKKNTESNDFTAPYPIEAKRRKQWSLQAWVRKIRMVSDDHKWAIFISPKNLHEDKDLGPVMVVSEQFGIELLAAHQQAQRTSVTHVVNLDRDQP